MPITLDPGKPTKPVKKAPKTGKKVISSSFRPLPVLSEYGYGDLDKKAFGTTTPDMLKNYPTIGTLGYPEGVGIPTGSRNIQLAAFGYGDQVDPNDPFGIKRNPPPVVGTGDGGGWEGVGYGGGGTVAPLHDIKWKEIQVNLENARAPQWWKALVPENAEYAERPDVQYLMMLNAMIPYLSPEDQQNAARQLYASAADAFSMYKPETLGAGFRIPLNETQALLTQQKGLPEMDKDYYLSQGRARGAINLLDQVRQQTVGGNRWKLGPGYTWLQQLLGSLEQFGGGGSRYYPDEGRATKTNLLGMLGALDPLLAQAQSQELGAYGPLGQMLGKPFFSQGEVFPARRVDSKWVFGRGSPLFYR